MKPLTIRKAALISAVVCLNAINGRAAVAEIQYPIISVTPSNPKPGADSVTLFLALGSASNSCEVPVTFTNVSFAIRESSFVNYPPLYNIALSYTSLVKTPVICPDVYAPVDYGPRFELGKLAWGVYFVTNPNMKAVDEIFQVFPSGSQSWPDTAYVSPKKPTTKDSLSFDLFNAGLNCCVNVVNQNVSVSDTMIVLSFQYNDSFIGPCPFPVRREVSFACGPQKTGNYALYKSQGKYCPTCSLTGPPIRVGQVEVSPASLTVFSPGAANSDEFSLREIKNGISWEYSLRRPGKVTIAIFNARGMRVAQLYKGIMGAGRYGFSWNAATPGAYFLSLELNGAPVFMRKIIKTSASMKFLFYNARQ